MPEPLDDVFFAIPELLENLWVRKEFDVGAVSFFGAVLLFVDYVSTDQLDYGALQGRGCGGTQSTLIRVAEALVTEFDELL